MRLTENASLAEWLTYLESIHPVGIDMGLDRVKTVYQRLALDWSEVTVITVAGTNGKGTTCAFIEAAAMQCGYHVGVYSSPHINIYNERVRINQQLLDDASHTQAFAAIEAARGDISLTYFEFGTLAGLWLLHQQKLAVAVLEVGLGGRLDAINVVDPDIAVITSIGLDHQAFLGDTRALIATEKAGIMRSGKPVIIGEANPPATLAAAVISHDAHALWVGQDFNYQVNAPHFHFHYGDKHITLPLPQIPFPNVATAMAVAHKLDWPLTASQWVFCATHTTLNGRLTVLTEHAFGDQAPVIMLDAAHNIQAAEYLAEHIQHLAPQQVFAVCGIMQDKDWAGVCEPLASLVSHWYPSNVTIDRAAKGEDIASCLVNTLGISQSQVTVVETPYQGVQDAIKTATDQDLVLIFGSFFTLSDFYAQLPSA